MAKGRMSLRDLHDRRGRRSSSTAFSRVSCRALRPAGGRSNRRRRPLDVDGRALGRSLSRRRILNWSKSLPTCRHGRQANPWGNGTSFQCVVPPVKRGGLLSGSGNAGTCTGAFIQDLNARWCPTCPKPAQAPVVGTRMQLQFWYRDPANTSNQTTSLSDGHEVDVAP